MVVGLLVVAAVLLRRKGAVPLALRGILRMRGGTTGTGETPALWKRLLAFILIIGAFIIAITN